MVRTKIEVNISLLKQRSRVMNIIIGSTTTARDVLCKVLEKCRVREPPDDYQLWATAKDKSQQDTLLGDSQRLSQVMSKWSKKTSVASIQFDIRPISIDPRDLEEAGSGLVRVYHQLYGDYESYLSYIVTPSTEARQLLEQAVAQLSPSDDMDNFHLVLKTGTRERVIGDTEHVLALQDGLSQLELKKRKQSPSHSQSLSHSQSWSHSQSLSYPQSWSRSQSPYHSQSQSQVHSKKPTIPIATKLSLPTEHCTDSPSNGVELQRSKLNLHTDLIAALREFASSSRMKKGEVRGTKTRESVLEKAVVEQNQILDVMQEVIASLERENQLSREKIEAQSKLIQDSVGWESRARKAERQLRDASRYSGSFESETASTGSFLFSFDKALAQKDQLIASLQAKLNAIPLETRRTSDLKRETPSSSSSSIRVQLTAERMKVIELEEELATKKAELAKLESEFTEHHSTILAKESAIQHLHHELELQRKSSSQQKELLAKQRQAMNEKDDHLISLARALEKEKKVTEQLRKRPLQSGYNTPSVLPKVADFLMPTVPADTLSMSASNSMFKLELTNLYDLVSGRDIHTVQITRPIGSRVELGFTYARTELPISSKLSCLIVKSVEKGGLVFGKLQPGDEILEVNGHACRSSDQRKAIECLETGNGVIKIVLAHDRDLSLQMQAHSTPLMSRHLSKREDTTLWATALPNSSETMFASFTDSASTPHDHSKTEYISFPTNSSEVPLADSITSSTQPKVPSSSPPPLSSLNRATEKKDQNHKEMKTEEKTNDEGTIQDLQTEVCGLQEQLDESERSRLELVGEVEAHRLELDNLQIEFDSTKSENVQLKQKAASHDGEVADIRHNVLELQAMLVKLENQVSDDQERIASLENHNRALSNELIEAKLLSDAAVKGKVDIENELCRLKEDLFEKVEAERRRDEDFQQLRSDKARLTADLELRDARIKELSGKLEKKTTEHQNLQLETDQQSKQLLSEITSLKETTVKSSSTAQQEQEHLQAQFTSVKNLLMEAQMKEAQQKVEMRYLKQAADMANEQLKVHEERCRKKEEELAIFKQLVESKTLEIESLTLGLKATQHKLEAKKEMLTRLQNEVDSLRRNCAKLQNEKSQTTEDLINLRSNLNGAESEVVRLEKKLEASVNEKDTLFQQLEESITESTQLQQELDQLHNNLEEAKADKERGRELSSKVEELTEEKRALEEELAKQIDIFKAEKKVLESELSQFRSESLSKSTTVQERLSRQEEEIKRQRDRLVACEGEKAKLSHSCENYKKREGELLEQFQSLTTDKESLVSELKKVTSQKDNTLRELEACQKKVEILNQQCLSIKEEKQTVETAAETLRKELKENVSESERLTTTREELVQQLKTLESQLDQARSEFERKSQEFQELNAAHSQLMEKSKIEQGHFEEVKSSVANLNEHNAKLQAEKKRSGDMVASLEFMHQQTQTRLEQVSDTIKIKETEVGRLKSELDEATVSLKKEKVETTSLKDSLSSVKEQLNKLEARRNKEVAELKEQLSVYMKEIGELQEQMQTEKSTNAGHKSLIAQLKSNTEHANKERYTVQSSFDAALKEKAELEARNKQLKGQLARSRSEICQLEDSGNFLSSESASLKLQLKQSSRESDELTAQLQAMEMNLEVTNRTLDESERERLEWTSQRENMELQVEDLKTALKWTQASLEETNLQLHTRDEELSKVKSNLELRQKECDKLQESVIAVSGSIETYEKKVGTLESEKLNLQAMLKELQEEQERLKGSLSVLEKEREDEASRLTDENEILQNQCKELQAKAEIESSRMKKLERSKREAEENVAQLLAAQEALKTSLNSLGDEKEVELVELQSQVAKFKKEVRESKEQLEETLSKSKEREEKLEQDHQMSLERCGVLEKENKALKEIAQEHKTTSDKLSELDLKMTSLQKSLKTKAEQLSNAEQSLQQTTSELKATRSENEELLGKVSELASIKVTLVEKSAEMDELRGQLATSSKKLNELTGERNHLLTTLRKLEVDKHSAAVKQKTPELPRSPGVKQEELLALLRDKEEEARQLKDYVGKLLSAVVEKAPFVLENV